MKCKHCGCVDEQACPGGCWWVAPEICSSCETKAVKALTLIRPWAWAIVASTKRIENRTWKADHIVGKRIAIHAGAKLDDRACVQIENFHGSALPASAKDMGIVGTALVTGFVTRSKDRWFCGPIGWTLADVIRFDEPIPCKGAQGLWNIPADVLKRIP